jgi:transposase
MPRDLPPWHAVYEQTRRWIRAGCFERLVDDLRVLIRIGEERAPQPTAVSVDSRTMPSSPESGGRAGYDGHKRRTGTKVHMAVDTLGELLAVRVTPAKADDRAEIGALLERVRAVTGEHAEVAFVDQGYTGPRPAEAAAAHGIQVEVVKLAELKRGFVLLPRRWVIERSFGWVARFRRLARDYERLPATVAALPFVAFACLILQKLFHPRT